VAVPSGALFAAAIALLADARPGGTAAEAALAAAAAAVVGGEAALRFTFDGVSFETEVVFLAGVLSSFVGFAGLPRLGGWACAACVLAEEVVSLSLYGSAIFSELTHVCLAIYLCLLALHLLLQTVRLGFDLAPIRRAAAASLCAAESVAFGLAASSSALLAVWNGNFDVMRDVDHGERWAAGFVVQHFLPLLASLLLSRDPVQSLEWLLALPLVCLAYAAALLAAGEPVPGAARVEVTAYPAAAIALGAWISRGALR
jgi:hypothetical protein